MSLPRHILIAHSTADRVRARTVVQLMALGQALTANGTSWTYQPLLFGDAALTRNIFASYVIADNVYTHVLFIAADPDLRSDTVRRAIAAGELFVVAGSPSLNPVTQHHRRNDAAEETPVGASVHRIGDDFAAVPAITADLMLIHRDVFEIMLAHDAERSCSADRQLPLLGAAPLCDFFSPPSGSDARALAIADHSFCRRWVETCGGKIWLYVHAAAPQPGTP